MHQPVIDNKIINTIKVLWQHHIPPRTIAEALDIKYATVSLYCRSFKALDTKLSPKDVCSKISGQYLIFFPNQTEER